MSKKVLVLSPCPTHPQNSGNRARVYSLLSAIRNLGHDVYFVYEDRERNYKHVQQRPDFKAMRNYWRDRFFVVPYKQKDNITDKYVKVIDRKVGRVGIVLKKVAPCVYSKLKPHVPFQIFLPYGIDDWFSPFLERYIRDISQTIKFDVVIVEYVWLSKALTYFGDEVLKIIDTIDAYTDIHKHFFKDRVCYGGFSATARNEAKGLERADVVIAIQDKEKDYFESLTQKRVVTIGHLLSVTRITKSNKKRNGKCILFCGVANNSNIDAVAWLRDKVLPLVKKDIRDIQVVLAGGVCSAIDEFDGCIKLGEVKDIKSAYDMADVVVVPMRQGAGLKIKSIESLGYGKPLVTTSKGMEGLGESADKAFLVSDTAEKFADHIVEIFTDDELRRRLSRNAYLFANRYNKKNLQKLERLFSFKSLVQTKDTHLQFMQVKLKHW